MKLDIHKILKNHLELFELNNIFNKYNKKIRIVGGCIRDALLHKEISENHDIDLCTTATPNEIIDIISTNNHIQYKNLGGMKFGSLLLIIKNKKYEITTCREDIKTYGRKAEVQFCKDFAIDSKRRDFTINAIYLDFQGDLYDYHNGIFDLEKQYVKFIGDPKTRIKEDYLRILRYLRFLTYFENPFIDDTILNICEENLSESKIISKQKIIQEFQKIKNNKIDQKITKILEKIKFLFNL